MDLTAPASKASLDPGNPIGGDVLVTQKISRRLVLGSAMALAGGASVLDPPFPNGATLLVAGPGGSAVDSWAEWLAPSLGRALPPGTPLRKDVVGGVDGVTGANQFEARTVPDGGTAMLLPGSAAMAWLVGDPRARFDASHWIPGLAGVTPGLVMSRIPIGRVQSDAPLSVAASGPAGPELPGLLALDLLGARWTPVYGIADAAALEALSSGQVDAICLHGTRVPEFARLLGSSGFVPMFSYGSVDDTGRRQRDPAFPNTPDASELLAGRQISPALLKGWRATRGRGGVGGSLGAAATHPGGHGGAVAAGLHAGDWLRPGSGAGQRPRRAAAGPTRRDHQHERGAGRHDGAVGAAELAADAVELPSELNRGAC